MGIWPHRAGGSGYFIVWLLRLFSMGSRRTEPRGSSLSRPRDRRHVGQRLKLEPYPGSHGIERKHHNPIRVCAFDVAERLLMCRLNGAGS